MGLTDKGANEIRDWLAGTAGATAPTYIAVGSDNTAPTKADTALITELTRSAISTTTTSDKEVNFVMVLAAGEQVGETLKEMGILNAGSAGDLFARDIHTSITKTANISVRYQYTFRIIN